MSSKKEEFDLFDGFEEKTKKRKEKVAASKIVTRMGAKDLTKFIADFDAGRIFTSAHMTDAESDLLSMVFMPLALGALSGFPEEELQKIGILWEYTTQAGPRSVNGLPCFFSCRIMHIDDWTLAVEKLKALSAAKKAILEEKE